MGKAAHPLGDAPATFDTPEVETGTRVSDREIALLLDNVGLVMDVRATLPQAGEAKVLLDGATALDLTVKGWVAHRPTDQEVAEAKREVLVLKDATSTLRARVDDVRRAVMRLLKIRNTPLTLLEISVLLRYHGHPAAEWDLTALREVLEIDPWVCVDGQTVSLSRA